MKTLALLIAALTATPAMAQVYECRSGTAGGLAVQVGTRFAIDDGRKVTVLCGRRGAGQCMRSGDGGWNYAGALGMIQFVPAAAGFSNPPVLRMQPPGTGFWTSYLCKAARPEVRRRFG